MPKELVVVSREQPELYASLKREFAGDPDVLVVLDRRRADRRTRAATPASDRRRQERRSYQEVDALRTATGADRYARSDMSSFFTASASFA